MSFDWKKISAGWWGAIAGGIGAGAMVFPNHRLLGALGGGLAMTVLAIKLTPCCDGCAAGQGCGGSAPTAQNDASGAPVSFGDLFGQSGPTPQDNAPSYLTAPTFQDGSPSAPSSYGGRDATSAVAATPTKAVVPTSSLVSGPAPTYTSTTYEPAPVKQSTAVLFDPSSLLAGRNLGGRV